ncbi:hypothetical protein DFH08DRAFT_820346 [Mycena albidolilacea]|uniref:Uncharacterized protein n=1 Tax=Mycena albidolilacea TaxID=1033008 RepID=A0AAD6ZD42_9AGAR|nr:hypothetical protein DFH08DRAFT_820346 [Mycena albidolilacea]
MSVCPKVGYAHHFIYACILDSIGPRVSSLCYVIFDKRWNLVFYGPRALQQNFGWPSNTLAHTTPQSSAPTPQSSSVALAQCKYTGIALRPPVTQLNMAKRCRSELT